MVAQTFDGDKIVQLYLQNKSSYEVARIVGCSQHTVMRYVTRAGVNRDIGEGTELAMPKPSKDPDAARDRARRRYQRITGRRLDVDEIVHHKDGNPFNNDMSNLEIMSRVEHTRLHNTKPFRGCCIEGCNRIHFGRGYCNLHYNRWRNGTPIKQNLYARPKRTRRGATSA